MANKISASIIACERCPRLRKYCAKVAKEKRKSFALEKYWGKPVPNFGDPEAKVLIVGLAPAAHGANRTGKMFTGDNSGVWLYRALDKVNYKVMITNVVHCAPPENKPTIKEIENCSEYLVTQINEIKKLKVFIALGQIALRGLWKALPNEYKITSTIPKFSHGAMIKLKNGMIILCSYHPSQQNTFTKKLTEPMFDQVFSQAKHLLLNI